MALTNPTRRAFFQRLAVSGCVLLPTADQDQIQYHGRADRIEVSRRKQKIQVVASEHPSGFAIDRFSHRLFVANEIDEYQDLPAGSVESYAIDPATGQIELRDRRRLSLSATGPKHLAISPDGRHLVVAAYSGGAYNVLPVQANGKIGEVKQVLKEIGSGPHPEKQATAHPHSVAFHPSGKLVVATDLGADRISLFSFESGRLRRIQQIKTPPGSGPADLRVSNQYVSVEYELQPFRRRYQFSSINGTPCLV